MDKELHFKEILKENKDRIFRICCAYERDPDSRNDLYQEVLLNVWKSLDKFEGRSMISTWIYRIAVNTSLMHVKKESRLNSMKTGLDENSIDIAETGTEEKERKIELGGQIEKLYLCINMLGKLERLIISMVLEDLSYKEIAEVTGLSPTNVGVKINRIKKELARLMEGAKMEIDDLKNIYKGKKASAEFNGPGQYDSLMTQLRRSERKVWIRSGLMTFFMLFAVYTLGGRAVSAKQYDPLTYAGFYLIFAAMAAVFVFVWSSVIVLRKKEVVTPSIQFLKKARRKLARRSLIRKIVIPVYLTAIIVGITLIYIEVLAPLDLIYRLLIHLLVIVFIIGISYIASRKERKRYETIYRPLESQIDVLLKEINRDPD